MFGSPNKNCLLKIFEVIALAVDELDVLHFDELACVQRFNRHLLELPVHLPFAKDGKYE